MIENKLAASMFYIIFLFFFGWLADLLVFGLSLLKLRRNVIVVLLNASDLLYLCELWEAKPQYGNIIL